MKRLALAACCLLPLGLGAQTEEIEKPEKPEKPLETITVSARPMALDQAGASVSVISREALEPGNTLLLHSLLRALPGLAVSQNGSLGGKTQLRVRGAEANHLLVVIDGMEANNPAEASEIDLAQLLTSDMERVEIVKGAQSALWGSDALAGVMHIITRPEGDETGLRLFAEGGDFQTGRGHASWRFATPKATGKFSLGAVKTGGVNIARRGTEEDGYRNLTLSASGSLAIREGLELGYTLREVDVTTEFDSGEPPMDACNETDADYLHAGLSLRHGLSARLSHALNLGRTDANLSTKKDGCLGQPDVQAGDKAIARYQFDLLLGQGQGLSLLAEHEEERFRQRGLASPYGDPNQNQGLRATSLAAEYRLDLPRVNLALGARRDSHSDFKDASSYRASVNWRLTEAARLFASAGTGAKNPTFTERFGFFTNFIGNPDLEPEESLAYEVGVSSRFAAGKGLASLALFHTDLENEINGFVFDGAGFTARNAAGGSDRRGAEAQLAYQPSQRLRLSAHYAYLDATEKQDGSGRDEDEIRRPRHTGSFALSYQAARGGFTLSATRTGDQRDMDFSEFPARPVVLDAFTLLRFAGHAQLDRSARLSLRLENLLDEDYEQVFGYASPGFAAYLGLQLSL